MSVEAVAIRCTVCEFTSSTRRLFGRKEYLTPVGIITVSRKSGWCEECQNLVSMENTDPEVRLRDLKEDLKSLQLKITSELNRLNRPKGWIERNFFPQTESESYLNELKMQYSILENEINQPEVLAVHLSGTQTPHCLHCGSIRVRLLSFRINDLKTIGEPGMKWTPMGFPHPGCKGELVMAIENFRINMRFTPQRYLLNGQKYQKKPSDN